MNTFITAVVVTHDSGHVLPECLDSLARAGLPVVVVDNASRDDSVAVAVARGATVIRNDRNEGFGRAANRGVDHTQSEFVLIVHPDVVLEPGAVAELLGAARRYPEAAYFAPRVLDRSGRVVFKARSLLASYLTNPAGDLHLPDGDACTPFLPGGCSLIKRSLFLVLGGFDEKIFLSYEDEDLCRRVADRSPALIYVPSAGARHREGCSTAPRWGRTFRAHWHLAWSRAYVSRKYRLPNPAPGLFARNALKTLGACLILHPGLIERYAGAAAGAWSFLMGGTALGREGLLRREETSAEAASEMPSRQYPEPCPGDQGSSAQLAIDGGPAGGPQQPT